MSVYLNEYGMKIIWTVLCKAHWRHMRWWKISDVTWFWFCGMCYQYIHMYRYIESPFTISVICIMKGWYDLTICHCLDGVYSWKNAQQAIAIIICLFHGQAQFNHKKFIFEGTEAIFKKKFSLNITAILPKACMLTTIQGKFHAWNGTFCAVLPSLRWAWFIRTGALFQWSLVDSLSPCA